MSEKELPQPGLDEPNVDGDAAGEEGAGEGGGSVAVDEPTEPALNPDEPQKTAD
jgi:hypothetical protein